MEHSPDGQTPGADSREQLAYNDFLQVNIDLTQAHEESMRRRQNDVRKLWQSLQPLITVLNERLYLGSIFIETVNRRLEEKGSIINELKGRVQQRKEQLEVKLQTLTQKVDDWEKEKRLIERKVQEAQRQLDEAIQYSSESLLEMAARYDEMKAREIELCGKISSLSKERDEAAGSVERLSNGIQESLAELNDKEHLLCSQMQTEEELESALCSKLTELEQAIGECENFEQHFSHSEGPTIDADIERASAFCETMKIDIGIMICGAKRERVSLGRQLRHLLAESADSRYQREMGMRAVKELRSSISNLLCRITDVEAKAQEKEKMCDSIGATVERMRNEVAESEAKVEHLSRCHEELLIRAGRKRQMNASVRSECENNISRIAFLSESLASEKESAMSSISERQSPDALPKEGEALALDEAKEENRACANVAQLRQSLSLCQMEVAQLEEQFRNTENDEIAAIDRLENEVAKLNKEFEEKERQIRDLEQKSCEESSDALMSEFACLHSLEREVNESSEHLEALRKSIIEVEESVESLDCREDGTLMIAYEAEEKDQETEQHER